MKRTILTCSLIIISLFGYGRNVTYNLSQGRFSEVAMSTVPLRVIDKAENCVIGSYEFENIGVSDSSEKDGTVIWSIPEFNLNYTPGEPATIFRNDMFTIPQNCKYQIELVDSVYVDVNMRTAAAYDYWDKTDSVGDEYEQIKPYSGFYPQSAVRDIPRSKYRGVDLVYVQVCPIQYNYETETTRIFKKLVYKLSFEELADSRRKTNVQKQYISPDDRFLNSFIRTDISHTIDVGDMILRDSIIWYPIEKSPIEVTTDYLILTTKDMKSAADRFAEWKKTLGYNATVISVDKGEWQTYDDVKSTILEFYETHPKLYYILLIGKIADIPSEIISARIQDEMCQYYSDYYYGFIDEELDDFPGFLVGRLPVSNIDHANIVIDKIINYERSPIESDEFYKSAIHCAHFDEYDSGEYKNIMEHGRNIKTSEEIGKYLSENHGYEIVRAYSAESYANPQFYDKDRYANAEPLPEKLLKPNFTWSYPSYDLAQDINSGVAYIIGLTHGVYDKWVDPTFGENEILSLRNGKKLPVVFSASCHTGTFCYTKKSLAESFLCNKNGGAVAVFAPSEASTTGWADALMCGMIDAIWPSPGINPVFNVNTPHVPLVPTPTPTYELGQILNQGKFKIDQLYKDLHHSSSLNVQYEIFHCFGDPSMKFLTENPGTYNDIVQVKRAVREIKVRLDGKTARISFYDKRFGKVTCYDGYYASYKTPNPNDVVVCVSGYGMKPYIDKYEPYVEDEVYIQNANFNTSSTNVEISAKKIFIGKSVNPQGVEGRVCFNLGTFNMKGGRIELHNGIKISKLTAFKLRH